MIYKQLSPTCGEVRVTFELPSCVWGDRIYVAGDFNQWNFTETPLKQDRDGAWRATVDLATGRQYEFRYLIDGKWQTDNHADGSRANEYGTDNSLIDTSLASLDSLRQASQNGTVVREPQRRPAVQRQLPLRKAPVQAGGQQRAA